MQQHHSTHQDGEDQQTFIHLKKLISLVMLFIAISTGFYNAGAWFGWTRGVNFFEGVYTVMIFADVLIVLISIRFASAYRVIFRYFGFAVATMLLRLALTAPRIVDAAIAVGAVLFCIALSWAYNYSEPILTDPEAAPQPAKEGEGYYNKPIPYEADGQSSGADGAADALG